MNDLVLDIVLAPLGVLMYLSGLLLWPIRRWLRRKRAVRGKSLAVVSIVQLASYLAIGVIAAARPRLLEHGYYWFIVLIELNIVFTLVGMIAWARDSIYENSLDGKCRTKGCTEPGDSASVSG